MDLWKLCEIHVGISEIIIFFVSEIFFIHIVKLVVPSCFGFVTRDNLFFV